MTRSPRPITPGERQYIREQYARLLGQGLMLKNVYRRIAEALGRPVSSVERVARQVRD